MIPTRLVRNCKLTVCVAHGSITKECDNIVYILLWFIMSSTSCEIFSLSVAGDTKSDLRVCLWKLPYEENPEMLTDDGTVRNLVKVADLGSDQHGDMKQCVLNTSAH